MNKKFNFSYTAGNESTTCISRGNDFQPVTEEEFISVSDLVRGRSKLEDVNKVLL